MRTNLSIFHTINTLRLYLPVTLRISLTDILILRDEALNPQGGHSEAVNTASSNGVLDSARLA